MKIGIHTGAWSNSWSNEKLYIIDECKEVGLDFIEFPLTDLSHFDPLNVKSRCEGAIEVTCSTVIPKVEWDIGADDPICRKNGIAFLKRCVDMTRLAGGSVFSGMCYVLARKNHLCGPAPEREWVYCAAAIKEVAQYAGDKGITIGIEPTGRYHNHLLNTAAQALQFYDMVGEPNVIIHLDSYHMCYEERHFYDAIKSTRGKLGYFHMNGNDRGRPGDDDLIDWDAVFRIFVQIKFDGYIGFEGFGTTSPHIYRDVIGVPKEFARESMKFVLKMMHRYGLKKSNDIALS